MKRETGIETGSPDRSSSSEGSISKACHPSSRADKQSGTKARFLQGIGSHLAHVKVKVSFVCIAMAFKMAFCLSKALFLFKKMELSSSSLKNKGSLRVP